MLWFLIVWTYDDHFGLKYRIVYWKKLCSIMGLCSTMICFISSWIIVCCCSQCLVALFYLVMHKYFISMLIRFLFNLCVFLCVPPLFLLHLVCYMCLEIFACSVISFWRIWLSYEKVLMCCWSQPLMEWTPYAF